MTTNSKAAGSPSKSTDRPTDNACQSSRFTDVQTSELAKRATDPTWARTYGVLPIATAADLPEGCPEYWTTEAGYLPGLLFRWESPVTGEVEYQLRPDAPPVDDKGDLKKYVFRKGAASVVHAARPVEAPELVLITEGTCQTMAAARYAPEKVAVYGIAGCQSWMKHGVPSADLKVVDGQDVMIVLDADASTNRDVYDAGVRLREACLPLGAVSVRFVRVPGGTRTGLDDVLGGLQHPDRADYLRRLLEGTQELRPREKPEAPAATKPKAQRHSDAAPSPFFGDGSLKAQALAEDVMQRHPCLLDVDTGVFAYADGVYSRNRVALSATVSRLLGDAFRVDHVRTVEEFIRGRLYEESARVPDRVTEPLLNVRNGMLDLRTGELHPHDPKYRSTVQLPVEWNPEATAPTYEAWLSGLIGDQVDDLEESASPLLDPTTTPTKALLLFGPSRTGKGTFLRLLQGIAGERYTAGISLHQLCTNRFMAANLHGKILNINGDLSAGHVEDLSIFKQLTGEDLVEAEYKGRDPFSFRNRALFAFACNTLPTVGENSRAYSERMRPFRFSRSFAGAEDPTIEDQLTGELPGILARLVAAWQRRQARGAWLPTATDVRSDFEMASDRVRRFAHDCCEVVPKPEGRAVTVTTKADVYRAYRKWADEQGQAPLQQAKVIARLLTLPGVQEHRDSAGRRGLNLQVRPTDQWGQQPSGRSGVGSGNSAERAASANPQVNPGSGSSGSFPTTSRTSGADTSSDHGEAIQPQGSGGKGKTARTARSAPDLQVSSDSPPAGSAGPPGTSARPVDDLDDPFADDPPALPRPRFPSAVDALFGELGDSSVPTCTQCGAAHVLIDQSWWTCPACDASTVASRPAWTAREARS